MPFSSGTYTRTDGVRSGSDVFVQQKDSGVYVTASLLDTEAQDMATALSTCLLKDGTQTVTANIPMSSKKFTGLVDGSARTDSATVANVQDGVVVWGGSASGTANAVTLTLAPAITAYVAGMTIRFLTTSTNTAAVTVNVNAVGAKNIKKRNSISSGSIQDLTAGDLVNDAGVSEIVYDGTEFILLNPAGIWQTWTITHTGFSVVPVYVARYKVEGKTVTCSYTAFTPGTSNATSYSVTAPVTAKTVANMLWSSVVTSPFDNGAAFTSAPAYCQIVTAGTSIGLFLLNTLWTNSGTKAGNFTLIYEAA